MTHVIKDDQRTVDTSDGVVANARFDGGHPGVNKLGGHGDGSSREVEGARDILEGNQQAVSPDAVVEDSLG